MLETTASQAMRSPPAARTAIDGAVLHLEARHLDAGAEVGALVGGELRQPLRHGARAALRIPHALGRLHVADGAEHRRRQVGAGADILAVMVQHLRQPRVRHVAADHLGHRPAHAQRHHVAQGVGVEVGAEVHGVEQVLDRLPEEEPLRHVVQGARHLLEAAVALAVALARREGRPWSAPSRRRPPAGRCACRRRRSSATAGRAGSSAGRAPGRARPRRRCGAARAAR